MKSQASPREGYFSTDTIVAKCSGPGAAIQIIRISGPQVYKALQALVISSAGKLLKPREMTHAKIQSSNGELLDHALVVHFPKPNSFTGEDVLEIFCHGGDYLSDRVVEEIGRLGIRPALPGEFSFRAVRNGKISLFQAEAILDVFEAKNDAALSLAQSKLGGQSFPQLQVLREDLLKILTLAEAGIDFSDQDIEEVSLRNLKAKLGKFQGELQDLLKSFDLGRKIQRGIPTLIVGAPNAGKSTLFNAILGEEVAITSPIAGTTRDQIRESFNWNTRQGPLTFRMIDSAGLRHSEDPIEKEGIDRTLRALEEASIVLFVLDPKGLEASNEVLNRFHLHKYKERILPVLNKSDSVSRKEIDAAQDFLQTCGFRQGVLVSALKREGITELLNEMAGAFGYLLARTQQEVWITRVSHQQAIAKALKIIEDSQHSEEHALLASDLRAISDSLGPLLGLVNVEDVLTEIFSQFCIGK